MQQALQYDTQGWDWTNRDFLERFPGLVATNNRQIEDAYNQLTGPLDPTVQGSFVRQGLNAGSNAVGGGDPLSGLGLTQGSAGRNAASVSFANSALEKQNYDRQNFTQILNSPLNQQRAFGLGGGDIAGLAALNTGGLNAFNQQDYQSQLSGIYAQGQQSAATGAQIAALGSLIAQMNFNNTGR